MSEYLSGIVSSLVSGVSALEGQILALPTNADIATFTALINGRLNVIETAEANQNYNVSLLLQNFANLKDTILNIDSILSTHTGYTIGDGVHGH